MTAGTGRRKPRRRMRGGTLVLIAGLLIVSATIRLGMQAGPALARQMAERSDGQQAYDPLRAGTADRDELAQVLIALRERRAALEQRERVLEDRARAIELADAALDRKLSELVEAEEALRAMVSVADGAAETDLARLTDVYDKMKPKEVAELFESMDPHFAAGFLARMRPEAAAGVMAGLSPQAAYSISVVLAGRNANAPKN